MRIEGKLPRAKGMGKWGALGLGLCLSVHFLHFDFRGIK